MTFDPKRYEATRRRRVDIRVGARSPFRTGFAFVFGSELASLLLRLAVVAAILAMIYLAKWPTS